MRILPARVRENDFRRARPERGFTLMELLVVLGIFSMVVTAASDIFMLTSRSQRKVFGLERTQSDARFTMEAITREIRTGSLDYAYYADRAATQGVPMTVPESDLALIDSADMPIRFFLSADASDPAPDSTARLCADEASTPCLLVSVNNEPANAITPKGVAVKSAAFYVSPAADPSLFDSSTGTYAADEQPRVTVVLTLESTAQKAEDRTTLRLQTTVVNRKYRR